MAHPDGLADLARPSRTSRDGRRAVLSPLRAATMAAFGLAVIAPGAALAERVSAPDMADVAMQVCIRPAPDASEGVNVKGFSVRSRIGQTYVYEHEAGPTMTLVTRPDFFNCNIEIPAAEPGYLDTLLSQIRSEIDARFGTADAHRAENGMLWQITTESDVIVSIDISERDEGIVSISSSADAAPLTQPTE